VDYFGGTVDKSRQPNGDKGIDHILWLFARLDGERRLCASGFITKYICDVKCRTIDRSLPVPVGGCKPSTMYFPARDGRPRATLLGWEWGWRLLEQKPRCYPGRDILNHCIPRRELRSLDELQKFLPV